MLLPKFFLLMMLFSVLACSDRNIIQQERQYVANNIDRNIELEHHYLTVDGHRLHYVMNGDPTLPALIIIHGTPGDWRQYARYMLDPSLLTSFLVVVVDRPGWGQSILANGQKIANFKQQAKIIAALAKELRQNSNDQPVIIMGHSLGASLAPQLAIDFPELIDGLLLFAGTIDPAKASPRWFNYLAKIPLSPWLIGEPMTLANQEIFALADNIAELSQHWSKIQSPVIAVQGLKDGLVHPDNINYIEEHFPKAKTTVVRLDDQGHLFPMTLRSDVVAWAKTLLTRVQP